MAAKVKNVTHRVDCPECCTKLTITGNTSAPVQCCPFCGNTILPADNDGESEEEFDDDGLSEFDPDDTSDDE